MAKSKTKAAKAGAKRRGSQKSAAEGSANASANASERPEHWGDYSDKQARTKDALIGAAFHHALFDGFTEAAILQAAAEKNIDENYALSLFPDPEADLIAWHSLHGDTRMTQEFHENYDIEALRIHERIKTLVMLRFRQNAESREAIRIASRKLLHPRHSALSLRLLARTCDAIWRTAGDTSTDWNFYSKRTLLAGVYTTTLPVWLDDESEDLQVTEAFLLRRLQDVLKFGKFTAQFKPGADLSPDNCLYKITRPFRFFNALSRYSAHKSNF